MNLQGERELAIIRFKHFALRTNKYSTTNHSSDPSRHARATTNIHITNILINSSNI